MDKKTDAKAQERFVATGKGLKIILPKKSKKQEKK